MKKVSCRTIGILGGLTLLVGCQGQTLEDTDLNEITKVEVQEEDSQNAYYEALWDEYGGLDGIISEMVWLIEAPEYAEQINLDNAFGLYYNVHGYHITDSEEDYNRLKEAFWDDVEAENMCGFYDCINKPESAFELVERYAADSANDFLVDAKEAHDEKMEDILNPGKKEREEAEAIEKAEEEERNARGKVTQVNYERIILGTDKISDVAELFGTKGVLVSEYAALGSTVQAYEYEGDGISVIVAYYNGVAESKHIGHY